jgi:formylglycine-generating enzyme required for sulfatase activity
MKKNTLIQEFSMQAFRFTYIGLLVILCITLNATTALAKEYTEPVTGMEFVLIKTGSYLMGDLYGTDQYAKPPHQVTVPEFYLGKYEVTFSQYEVFCKETKCDLPSDEGFGMLNRPAINIKHSEAIAFTKWLSKKSGQTFRLPTEAEWEYAARAGKSTNYWWGTGIGEGNANCMNCGSEWDKKMTAPVGSFRANPYGLYDMQGNVYEWVADSWHKDYQGAPADGSAWVDKTAKQYVSRGGSWLEIPSSLYVFSRNWSDADERRKDIGFRVLMEP